MKTLKKVASIGLMTIAVTQAQAGNLIYQPINPSFGGDPFVGSYLLGKAQAQDTTTDPNTRSVQSLSSTERLLQNLESRLISQLISDVSRGEVDEGSFDSDEFGVVVSDSSGQLVVRVVDKITGDVTEISVGGLFNP
ncbi:MULTISPECIES: curli assembly protein CsgF [Halomonadaceae]|jgi:curli production assembly/transport component CsgF|uniref:Curli production assembly/transport component CsgF n=1 Tax=Vreelandella aquamarina TaxID=77097 RepID=A0A0D7UZT8_9GAMM|nr:MULTISPECIES: curli assembly protein CsgF [Halomonas]KTG26781.1 curli production assembly protein CsgF [Idiomarina sp. H105]MEC9020183.1 curli assembly protein CsgF [Pseudomonadota bacterium]OAF01053.1 curli production assembly protein CsgF [Idiomarina sp. WRN-38]KJD20125.1 curli production assembly protein CsgF [Halomonas meridiana]MAD21751.1 curli production assembly protein CsgF [Halomonas sp.]|tara:strand:+ start:818 stop:1228 length:411 start_codon:yes stop_codon:yes gene_type:complete